MVMKHTICRDCHNQTVRLAEAQKAQIKLHAEAAYPNEAVGALIGTASGCQMVVPAANIATQPDRFEVAPPEALKILNEAEKLDQEVIGWYHSHPDHPAVPSPHDQPLLDQGLLMLIATVQNGIVTEMRCWQQGEHGLLEVEVTE